MATAYDPKLMVQDILAVMDMLTIGKACYLGVSQGGVLGYGLLKYAPERIQALLVVAADPYTWNPQEMDFLYTKLRSGMKVY